MLNQRITVADFGLMVRITGANKRGPQIRNRMVVAHRFVSDGRGRPDVWDKTLEDDIEQLKAAEAKAIEKITSDEQVAKMKENKRDPKKILALVKEHHRQKRAARVTKSAIDRFLKELPENVVGLARRKFLTLELDAGRGIREKNGRVEIVARVTMQGIEAMRLHMALNP